MSLSGCGMFFSTGAAVSDGNVEFIAQHNDKAVQKHDRDYRTESYVSTFADGADYASTVSVGGSELGTRDISRKQAVPKKQSTKSGERRLPDLPSGMDEESLGVDYEQ